MELIILVLLVLLIIVIGVVLLVLTKSQFDPRENRRHSSVSQNLKNMVSSQRAASKAQGARAATSKKSSGLAFAAAEESKISRKQTSVGSRMNLEKKLRYAYWPITPFQFRAIQIMVTVCVTIPAGMLLTAPLAGIIVLMTPVVVSSLLDKAVEKRFLAFDADYPVMLLSYVSLLKTGMNTINGLESAARGLEPHSLARSEVELLMERLRLGLTEEQAISALGEDIAHPELELFVQSLILSRRVGGQLSSTLERLAKQVRKRQQFRQQAVAEVGMERGSIWAITGIMLSLLAFLVFRSPELIEPAFTNDLGKMFFQGGVGLILVGFYWSRKVTNIKV